MRLLAACALAACATAYAQLSVDETTTRTKLVDNATSVSLALTNQFGKPVDVRIDLQWLDTEGVRRGRAQVPYTAPPGKSAADVRLPLTEKDDDPLLYRLRYSVMPDSKNLTVFTPLLGMLSFPHIADHAFRLAAVAIGTPQLGRLYEFRVFAAHPISNRPAQGVRVSIDDVSATTDTNGAAIIRLMPNPEDWTDSDDVTVVGQLGDLEQTAEVSRPALPRNAVRIYTDKPLYQPGQTAHLRILAFGLDGRARNGAKYSIRIFDRENAVVQAADVTTSRFGIAHTAWEIPTNAENGRYKVEVEPNGDDDDNGRTAISSIEVRRYELPSFRVSVQADRPFYLPGQEPSIEIRADYLFGKPVAGGKVRLSAGDEEAALREGALDSAGRFRTAIELEQSDERLKNARYIDLHYTAYVTDGATNRTERRRFDIRLSRDPIHIYVVRSKASAAGIRLYVATYTADGKPVICDIEALSSNRTIASGRSNRFGLARLDVPSVKDELRLRARAQANTSFEDVGSLREIPPGARVETSQSLYRAGQPIQCRIAAGKRTTGSLLAWREDGQVLYSRAVALRNGSFETSIPYDTRFTGMVFVAFVSPLVDEYQMAHPVLYPAGEELRVSATPVKDTYRPGQRASVSFQALTRQGVPVEAALGIAIVDQSVLERFAADQGIGRRRWLAGGYFDRRDESIGGISLGDLSELDPTKIDGDYELVAEALLGDQPIGAPARTFADEEQSVYASTAAATLEQVKRVLDDGYHSTLAYPRDEESLVRIAGTAFGSATDPWMRPYRVRFSIHGPNDILEFVSGGPDKTIGTEDDFVGLTVQREWFFPFKALIREALSRLTDYPSTPAEVMSVVDAAGIRFDSLRDPWQNPLRVRITHRFGKRIVEILSAGPDHAIGTSDDFTVAEYQGTFFRATEERIERAIEAAPAFPTDEAQLRSILAAAGIDMDREKDPWGHSYSFAFRSDSQYADRYQIYSYAEYQGIAEQRRQVIPTKHTFHILEIRSSGEDGVEGTYDDFTVAHFSRMVQEDREPEKPATAGPIPSVDLGGRGTLTGLVTDPTGAVIPGADVILNDVYRTRTDENGRYYFRGVPPGTYTVRFSYPGFQATVIGHIPVRQDRVTNVNGVLSLGSVSETVEVSAAVVPLATETSSMIATGPGITAGTAFAPPAALATPRVREYFPETLFWNPELITNAGGRASVDFTLADSITSWHIAAVASTEDGRIAETSAEIKAFQPFFVDLDAPPILTAGDEITLPVPIRNYLDREETVSVEVTSPPALAIIDPPKRSERLAASSSASSPVRLRAAGATASARLRVAARAKDASDAIEKPVAIHPDGEAVSRSVSDIVEDGRAMLMDVPADAIQGSIHAEVKLYSTLLSQVIESMEALLQKPAGCAEQTISLSYPNLLVLRALKDSGLREEKLETRARRNLESGYRRLLGYRTGEGGFAYWSSRGPDLAVTAYAVEFLNDAKGLIELDPDVLEKAQNWIARQKPSDVGVRGLALRALAGAGRQYEEVVISRLGELARDAAKMDDPYAIATFALAALDARRPELARTAIDRLRSLARDERGMAYWHLQRNTPYFGSGRAGRIEATALVLTALSRWRKQTGDDPQIAALIGRGTLFLLRSKDEYGVWLTTQATVRTFVALLESLTPAAAHGPEGLEIYLNGALAGDVRLPDTRTVQGPATVDLSRFIKPGVANELSIKAPNGRLATQARFTATWYEPWKGARTSPQLGLDVRYSITETAPNQPVRCDVTVSRPGFRGYGMVIAEVGLPPGAEVDRGTLADLIDKSSTGVDSVEVAPDHVTFYVWPRAADSKFSFTFRPRYPVRARTAASVLYDYYNPDERAVLPPTSIIVRDK